MSHETPPVGASATAQPRTPRTTLALVGILCAVILLFAVQAVVRSKQKHADDPLHGDSDEAMSALSTQLDHTPVGERKHLLLQHVVSDSAALRYSAVDALGNEKGPEVADALEHAFRDSASIVRQRAMETLPRVDGDRGLRLLLAGLRDEDTWIRDAAIQQISTLLHTKQTIVDRRAVPTLIRTLDDADPVLPITAMNALRTLTGKPWHVKSKATPAEKQAAIASWKRWWAEASQRENIPLAYRNIAPIRPDRADPAPNFQLQDTEGKTIRLSDQRGHVTLLNFWGTWCPPCQMELPDLAELDRIDSSRGLSIIGVALGEHDGPQGLHNWCMAHHLDYRQALAPADMLDAYGHISEVPVSVLIDAQGKIRYRWEGERDLPTFRAAVERLLEESHRTKGS